MTATDTEIDDLVQRFLAGEPVLDNPAIRADPHPLYHRIRELPPTYMPNENGWIFTRWDDCEQVLRDVRFSSNPAHRDVATPIAERSLREQFELGGEFRTLLFLDPPDHTRIRGLVSKAFTPRTVERLRPHIAEITNGILDEAAAVGHLDVVGQLGYLLPVTVICELLGVPVSDREMFGPWSSDISRLLDNSDDEAVLQRGMVAFMGLMNYLNGLIDERRAHPGDDLLSGLLAAEEAGDRLDETELRSIVILLFIAGHETTMNLIGNGTWALLEHPDQLARLRDDPTLIGSTIEELLRYDGPVHVTGRIATTDLAVGDLIVRKGQQVITLLAAANRDPDRFDDPDRLDIGRPDNRHLTFSHGIHYCLGAALARVEGQVAISSLLNRFASIEPTEAPTYRDHFVLRGLNSLHVDIA